MKRLVSRLLMVLVALGGALWLPALLPAPLFAQRAGGQGQGGPGGGGFGQGGQGGQGQGGGLPGGRGGAQPRDNAAQISGTGIIRGHVVTADTGTPVRRAQVRAVANELRVSRLASTDAQGMFELKDLPAGRWTLTASKAGFVTLQYGQKRPFESGQLIALSDAQVLERTDFSLPRGSAITGHVFDEFGDPVVAARIQVLRYQTIQGQRRLTPAGGGAQSDDTGAFRVYGLAPGEYFISATLRAGFGQGFAFGPGGGGPGGGFGQGAADEGVSYAPTFYPGTGNVGEAQKISLAVGQEQGSVNFALLPVRTVHIAGSALDSSGSPISGGIVALTGASETGLAFPGNATGGRTRPDGTFTLTNVAPGSYTLTATSGLPRGRGNGAADVEMASVPITVGNDDLVGLTVITGKGARLSGGVVTVEGSSGQLKTNGLQIVAQALRFDAPAPGAGTRPARVETDGSFQLTNLIGQRVIRLNGLPQEWMLKAVMMNSTDITDSAVDFKGNDEITGVQILVTDKMTEVNGKVTARGEPTRDYTVVVFPEDSAKWAFPSRFVKSGRADQQGLFKIRALPPDAHYLAVAVDYLEDGEGSDPQFLEQIKDRAVRFGLADGESKALDLKIVNR